MSDPRDKHQVIKKAAAELFLHYGYSKTSMEDIARAAYIGKGTIYYYYPAKEELFIDVLSEYSEQFFHDLQKQIDAEPSFEGKLKVYLRTPLIMLKEHLGILTDAMSNLSHQYLGKIDVFRQDNKSRIYLILSEILDFGIVEGLIESNFPSDRFIEIINDWFLLGDNNLTIVDKEKLIQKVERDSEWIIQIILYGIVKRG